jgi:threonine aldolase
MREAMLAAPLGDDVFGDDPAVNALQEKIAGLLGFEAALFVPTGTQSNLCGILSHCQRGDEYIVGQMAHCYRWEGGGAAVFGSVQPQPLNHHSDGTLAPGRDRGLHQARRRALRAHPAAGAGKHPGRQAAAL